MWPHMGAKNSQRRRAWSAALGARGSALAACVSAERCGAALSSEDLDAEIRAIKRQQEAHEQPRDVEASLQALSTVAAVAGRRKA